MGFLQLALDEGVHYITEIWFVTSVHVFNSLEGGRGRGGGEERKKKRGEINLKENWRVCGNLISTCTGQQCM